MQHKVKLPKIGDTTQVALIAEWFCAPGDAVEVGTPLVLVETDKLTLDVPSPVRGVLIEHVVALQDEVEVGATICIIEG